MESRQESANRRRISGTPLDLRYDVNPRGIREVVIDYGEETREVWRPQGEKREFEAYELFQMATYLKDLAVQQRRKQ
ncbi:hypothetical protein E0L93_08525 [Rubrobacter taiwanensis]|jgi:hypothetical protein|uniref:Uncharacterized protein n=2 Tax=Rubrobacter taiwanensis TaxID=185139 RepID=A0A4R1BHP8_9ACTN|nr:hypothetical protein E0L93_08525 [Rubrobacter taiwanensis]